MTAAEFDAYVSDLVDDMPPLNADQQAVIRRIFGQHDSEVAA